MSDRLWTLNRDPETGLLAVSGVDAPVATGWLALWNDHLDGDELAIGVIEVIARESLAAYQSLSRHAESKHLSVVQAD